MYVDRRTDRALRSAVDAAPLATDDEIEAALEAAFPGDACEVCGFLAVGHGCGTCKAVRVCSRCWMMAECCESRGVVRP